MAGEIGRRPRWRWAWLRERYPEPCPFALAGFSFGARVITDLGCARDGARFLLAAGFSTRLGGTAYLQTCAAPKIFVQSTHDQYAPRAELEPIYAKLPEPKELIWIEAADHFFAGGLEELEERVREAALGGGS
jgi:alpha/beta superfamily hydrolase